MDEQITRSVLSFLRASHGASMQELIDSLHWLPEMQVRTAAVTLIARGELVVKFPGRVMVAVTK